MGYYAVIKNLHHGSAEPLSEQHYMNALTNCYWVSRMAFGLELITMTNDLDEVHAIAREHLELLVDPVEGLRSGIPDEIHLRWRIAARGGLAGATHSPILSHPRKVNKIA